MEEDIQLMLLPIIPQRLKLSCFTFNIEVPLPFTDSVANPSSHFSPFSTINTCNLFSSWQVLSKSNNIHNTMRLTINSWPQ